MLLTDLRGKKLHLSELSGNFCDVMNDHILPLCAATISAVTTYFLALIKAARLWTKGSLVPNWKLCWNNWHSKIIKFGLFNRHSFIYPHWENSQAKVSCFSSATDSDISDKFCEVTREFQFSTLCSKLQLIFTFYIWVVIGKPLYNKAFVASTLIHLTDTCYKVR